MRLTKQLYLAISVTGLITCSQSLAATIEDIGASFFPSKLKARIVRKFGQSADLNKFFNCKSANLDGVGNTTYLVCVYSDRTNGALRVIRSSGPNPTLVAETAQNLLYGVTGSVKLIDLNGDKKPEIYVDFMSGRGNATSWLFSWTGTSLQLISPVNSSNLTALGEISFYDLSGTGTLSIVTDQPTRSVTDDDGNPEIFPNYVYSFSNDQLTLANTLYYKNEFSRNAGAPQDQTDTISISDTSKSYVLKVYDLNMSKPDTGPLTSSATVSLNGKPIIGPSDFNPGKRIKVISKPIQVQPSNQLSVKVAGTPGSKIFVTISQSQ